MPNINEFSPVIHEKNIFKGICYLNLHKTMSPQGLAICDPWDFIWANGKGLVLRMIHIKQQYIQATGSREDDFLKIYAK